MRKIGKMLTTELSGQGYTIFNTVIIRTLKNGTGDMFKRQRVIVYMPWDCGHQQWC
jgi:hypothetical protein